MIQIFIRIQGNMEEHLGLSSQKKKPAKLLTWIVE